MIQRPLVVRVTKATSLDVGDALKVSKILGRKGLESCANYRR